MAKKLRTMLVGLTILLLPVPAAAWNDTAHMIIAQIAYSRLNPAAATRVAESARLLSFKGERYDPITIATYMDDLRADPYYDRLRLLHFINKPLENGAEAPDFAKAEEKSDRNLTYLNQIIKELKQDIDRSNVEARLNEAQLLAYLIHMVGDAHQPLHCVNRFSRAHPNGDAGGNLFFIRPGFRSLHSFWDSGGGLFDGKPLTRPLDVTALEAIRNYAYRITLEFPDKKNDWKEMAVEKWIEESYEIADDDVYNNIQESANLSQAYVMKAQNISRARLSRAGYRLAALLNDIYSESPQPSRPSSPRPARRGARVPN